MYFNNCPAGLICEGGEGAFKLLLLLWWRLARGVRYGYRREIRRERLVGVGEMKFW